MAAISAAVDLGSRSFVGRLAAQRGARLGAALVCAVVAFSLGAPLWCALAGAPPPDRPSYRALTTLGAPTGPSLRDGHLLGVDTLGRDLFARLAYGGRASLEVALLAAAFGVGIGALVGGLAGYLGGVADTLIARAIDLLLAFPALLLAVGVGAACQLGHGCLGGVVRPGLGALVFVIALVNLTYVARLVRAQAASLRASPFVLAARAQGAGPVRVIARELAPNLSGPVLTYATLALPQNILLGAALSYLGLGVAPPTPSWGAMLAEATPLFASAWWLVVFPGLALVATVAGFYLLGEGVQAALLPAWEREPRFS